METVRFYFSFRSPYAWVAFHTVPAALAELPIKLDMIPWFPGDEFPNDPSRIPNKVRYMLRHGHGQVEQAIDARALHLAKLLDRIVETGFFVPLLTAIEAFAHGPFLDFGTEHEDMLVH